MMKIVLLSDTHSALDERITKYLEQVDEIWHAGDIGDMRVAETLEQHAPLMAVYGNIDHGTLKSKYPEFLWFERAGCRILMTHIAGRPGRYSKPLLEELKRREAPDMIVCGHSHILLVKKDPRFNALWLNPGACGNQGFHQTKTMLRFDIENGMPKNMEVIEWKR